MLQNMKPSLIPAEQASHFYMHWMNASREKRTAKIQSLITQPLNRLNLEALLKREMDDGYPLPRAMRRLRNLLICAIIERDLSGKADLSEVVETMTRFAEFAIRTHLKTLSEELTAGSRYTDRSPFWHTSGNDYSRNGETWGGEN